MREAVAVEGERSWASRDGSCSVEDDSLGISHVALDGSKYAESDSFALSADSGRSAALQQSCKYIHTLGIVESVHARQSLLTPCTARCLHSSPD